MIHYNKIFKLQKFRSITEVFNVTKERTHHKERNYLLYDNQMTCSTIKNLKYSKHQLLYTYVSAYTKY